MPVGYAIVYVNSLGSHDEPQVRVGRVVWDAAEAAEVVQRLNATGRDDLHRYSWQTVWVPSHDGQVRLTPEDRELLDFATLHGVKDTERPLAVFFSFIFNRTGAEAAIEELRTRGWPNPRLDEEVNGDDCWHVYAHHGRRVLLSEAGIAELRQEMEGLADRHGGTFDHWEVGGGGALRWGTPAGMPE
jgi:hypothetical protein